MGEYSIYSSFHFTLIRSLGHKQRTQVPQKVYFERDLVINKEACLFGSKRLLRSPNIRSVEMFFKKVLKGFPGGTVVENLPANAGHTGSSPGLGRSHMPWSNWAREPQLLRLRVWNLCSAPREDATVRGPRTAMKSGPRSPQLEKALAQKQRPNTAKNK